MISPAGLVLDAKPFRVRPGGLGQVVLGKQKKALESARIFGNEMTLVATNANGSNGLNWLDQFELIERRANQEGEQWVSN